MSDISLGLYHPSSRESVVSTRAEGISLAVLWYQVTPKYGQADADVDTSGLWWTNQLRCHDVYKCDTTSSHTQPLFVLKRDAAAAGSRQTRTPLSGG
jgi:hypothetical protein